MAEIQVVSYDSKRSIRTESIPVAEDPNVFRINGATYSLYAHPEKSQCLYTKPNCADFESIEFIYENGIEDRGSIKELSPGTYLLKEEKPPVSIAFLEDENGYEIQQVTSYIPQSKIVSINDKNETVIVELAHFPKSEEFGAGFNTETRVFDEELKQPKSNWYRWFNLINRKKIYKRDHLLASSEKRILYIDLIILLAAAIVACSTVVDPLLLAFLQIIKLSWVAGVKFFITSTGALFSKYLFNAWSAFSQLTAANPEYAIGAGIVVVVILASLIGCGILSFYLLDKITTPLNSILDFAPEPIKPGEKSYGKYGTADICRDKETFLDRLGSVRNIDQKTISDVGSYAGYIPDKESSIILATITSKLCHILALKKQAEKIDKRLETKGTYLYIPGDLHSIIFGDTRSGKTRRWLLATLHLLSRGKNESLIIFDSKGELLAFTQEEFRKQGYDVFVYDFERPAFSNRHNPLYLAIRLYEEGRFDECVSEIAEVTTGLTTEADWSGELRYFTENTMEMIKAVCLAVVADKNCPKDQKTFTTVARIIDKLEVINEIPGTKPKQTYVPLDEYMKTFAIDSPVRKQWGSCGSWTQQQMGNFKSTANGFLQMFKDPQICEMTSITDNPFDNVANRKQVIYINSPITKESTKSLATIMLDQLYKETRGQSKQPTFDAARGRERSGRTAFRVNFICEEILSINPWQKLSAALDEGAGMGLRFFLIIQNQSLFAAKYGKEVAMSCFSNSPNKFFIKTGDKLGTTPLWEALVGVATYAEEKITYSGSRFAPIKTRATVSEDVYQRARLTESELLSWNADNGLLIATPSLPHVGNTMLPDVSILPTEKYFGLGTVIENMEKTAEVMKLNFRRNQGSEKRSRAMWLPGITDAQNIAYTAEKIEELLAQQDKRYQNKKLKEQTTTRASKQPITNKAAIIYSLNTGEFKQFDRYADYQKELISMVNTGEIAGWRTQEFNDATEANFWIAQNLSGKTKNSLVTKTNLVDNSSVEKIEDDIFRTD